MFAMSILIEVSFTPIGHAFYWQERTHHKTCKSDVCRLKMFDNGGCVMFAVDSAKAVFSAASSRDEANLVREA